MERMVIQTTTFATRESLLDFLSTYVDEDALDGITQASIMFNDDGLWECSYPVTAEEDVHVA